MNSTEDIWDFGSWILDWGGGPVRRRFVYISQARAQIRLGGSLALPNAPFALPIAPFTRPMWYPEMVG